MLHTFQWLINLVEIKLLCLEPTTIYDGNRWFNVYENKKISKDVSYKKGQKH